MIQDIYPSKLDNSFKDLKPNDNDCIFLFNDEGKIYAGGDAEGKMVFLTFHDCKADDESALFSFVYLFSVDQKSTSSLKAAVMKPAGSRDSYFIR